MNRVFLTSGAALAALAVMAGAFGAHSLKTQLELEQLQVFETAVRYQLIHSIALLLTGMLYEKIRSAGVLYAGRLFLAGILLFSGSLYVLSMQGLFGIESWKILGPVTPFGGLCLILGWIFLFISFIRHKS